MKILYFIEFLSFVPAREGRSDQRGRIDERFSHCGSGRGPRGKTDCVGETLNESQKESVAKFGRRTFRFFFVGSAVLGSFLTIGDSQ